MSSIRLEIVPDPELFPRRQPAGTGWAMSSSVVTTVPAPVPPALSAAISQLMSLIRAGIITADEVRAQLGLPG